ncbi:hypothetical protein PVW46_14915 [Mameliella sp. AT18]|uniref:hypothetical protein n=1 Tax=Mameliella sp. AT18 TaxID=3028385 RepID=UPI000840FEF5|nr:hypothetical protein [Mameliella sp. AT18]MDD9731205.1 hypothetical protein [Mameliella sp. AT18]ODM46757.1 hypothetical protein A9320_24720 [Ruegeria sp. PBVC088]
MTLKMHARLTADGKQAQAELAKTGQGARGLKTEVDALGQSGQEASADFVALQKQLEAYKVDLVNLRNEHAAAKKQIDGLRGELTKLKTQAGQASGSVAKISAPLAEVNKGLSPAAQNNAKMFAYQLNQVAQQGAVTGNYMGALSIQSADMLSVFGLWGVIAGGVVAVMGPLAMSLFDTSAAGKEAQKSVDVFLDTLSEVQGYTDTAKTSIKDLRREFGDFAREVQQASALAAQATVSLAFSEFDDAAKGIRSDLDDVVRAIGDVARANKQLLDAQDLAAAGILGERQVTEAREALELLEDRATKMLTALGLSAAEATRLDAAFDDLAKANSLAEVAEAASAAVMLLRGMYDESERIPDEVARIIQNLNSMVKAASAGAVAMGDTKEETGDAADEASRLAANILTAANNAIAFQQAMASLSIPFEDAMEELDFELATAGMNAADKLVATRVRRLEETMRAASERTFGFDYGLTDEQKSQLADYEASLRSAAPTLTADTAGAAKARQKERDAVRDLIAARRDELAILRESDPIQQEMIRLRGDLAGATDAERAEVAKLIASIQKEELAKAQAAETSEFFRTSFADLIPDLVRGGDDAASAWHRFARALEDAAWQALLLGEGPLMGLFGGGGGGSGGGLFGWIGEILNFADGGMHYGQGGPRADKKLVRVSPGEFTVNAAATQRHRPLLEAINAGTPIPGFADGGSLSSPMAMPGGREGVVEIRVYTEEGTVAEIARNEAGAVVRTGFAEYDRVLPDRVAEIRRDPRVRY